MALGFKKRTPSSEPETTALELAFNRAMSFGLEPAGAKMNDDDIRILAADETRFEEIRIDSHGLPAGAAHTILEKAQDILRQWGLARGTFDTELAPKRADLEAVNLVQIQKFEAIAEGKTKQQQAESQWLKDSKNVASENDLIEAEARLRPIKLERGNGTPTMIAYQPIYWVALFAIGIAEWLINYDIFFLFTGVPAIAAGATVILAALLAFSAHAHGEVLKQWSHRFGVEQQRESRFGSFRLLVLATLALSVVLIAAGGSRYAAVIRTMASQSGPNILGNAAMIDVNATRDVLLSLLANFAAWIVGVFIAFYCHDKDPEFMQAQRQFDKAQARRNKRRKVLEEEQQSIEAKAREKVDRADLAARTRLESVSVEHGLLKQIEKQEQTILQSLSADCLSNAERLRNALCRTVLVSKGQTKFLHEANGEWVELKGSEYRNMPIDISGALLKGLL